MDVVDIRYALLYLIVKSELHILKTRALLFIWFGHSWSLQAPSIIQVDDPIACEISIALSLHEFS